jgi:hypothetical protein
LARASVNTAAILFSIVLSACGGGCGSGGTGATSTGSPSGASGSATRNSPTPTQTADRANNPALNSPSGTGNVPVFEEAADTDEADGTDAPTAPNVQTPVDSNPGASPPPPSDVAQPTGMARDTAGNLYIADSSNHTIRRVTPDGVTTTLAGSAGNFGLEDGTGSAARFRSPRGISIDANNNLYVADMGNNLLRRVTPDGVVTTVASGTTPTDGTPARKFDYPIAWTLKQIEIPINHQSSKR